MTMMPPLHTAVATGDVETVRTLLVEKPDVNGRTEPNGYTPMHICVLGTDGPNRQKIIELLHSQGADLEARIPENGLTALQYAAMRNRPLCLSALIRCGADIHATEGNKATALHGAAYFGHVEVARILVDAGADPERVDANGLTPVSLSRARGHEQIVQILSAATGKKAGRYDPATLKFVVRGDGLSEGTAAVIQAPDGKAGFSAEYAFIESKYGPEDSDWAEASRGHIVRNGRHIHDYEILLKSGERKHVFIDITSHFGKPLS
jgi:hypothetical protein